MPVNGTELLNFIGDMHQAHWVKRKSVSPQQTEMDCGSCKLRVGGKGDAQGHASPDIPGETHPVLPARWVVLRSQRGLATR